MLHFVHKIKENETYLSSCLHIPPQERQKSSIYETNKISRCLIDKDRLESMLLVHGEWFSQDQNGEYPVWFDTGFGSHNESA